MTIEDIEQTLNDFESDPFNYSAAYVIDNVKAWALLEVVKAAKLDLDEGRGSFIRLEQALEQLEK